MKKDNNLFFTFLSTNNLWIKRKFRFFRNLNFFSRQIRYSVDFPGAGWMKNIEIIRFITNKQLNRIIKTLFYASMFSSLSFRFVSIRTSTNFLLCFLWVLRFLILKKINKVMLFYLFGFTFGIEKKKQI